MSIGDTTQRDVSWRQRRRWDGLATASFAGLPAVNAKALDLILDMSPFARERNAFDRTTRSAPQSPPIEVKLTGILWVVEELRPSAMINDESLVVRTSNEMAVGKSPAHFS